jgi:CopG-like RHH_1 or ribbon-helix-helix domain, RHH_5
MDAMAKINISVLVEEYLREDLKRLANAERRSVSQLVGLLIEDAVAQAKAAGKIPFDEQEKPGK